MTWCMGLDITETLGRGYYMVKAGEKRLVGFSRNLVPKALDFRSCICCKQPCLGLCTSSKQVHDTL